MSKFSQWRHAARRDPGRVRTRTARLGPGALGAARHPFTAEPLEDRTLLSVPAVETTEGVPFSGVVSTFVPSTEGEPASYFKATINWGDGTTSDGTIVLPPSFTAGATYSVMGTHTYNGAGDLPITVTVTDLSTNVVSRGDTDASKFKGSESSPTIAVNPLNPNVQFAASNLDTTTGGLLASVSSDGGKTWTTRKIATGDPIQKGGDGLVAAFGDPQARFDQFGNLFLVYIDSSGAAVELALSTDGGQTFHRANGGVASNPTVNGIVDQPHIAVGPGYLGQGGSIWISYQDGNGLIATTGAQVYGLGQFGEFSAPVEATGSMGGNYGDVAVGPNGQVTVIYQVDQGNGGPDTIFANVDPDGLGGEPFGPQVTVTSINIAPFDTIPASGTRAIDAEAKLAWDLSTNPFDQHPGRLYMAYTDATTLNGPDTNIFVRYSDDSGSTWSSPVKVNDDTTTRSQFFSQIAVDPFTGTVGVAWYDARNDPNNQAVDNYAAVSSDGGRTFSTNVQINSASSNATNISIDQLGQELQYGDYSTLAFEDGVLYPVWVGNAAQPTGNPDLPAHANMDIITNQITVAHINASPYTLTGTTASASQNIPFTGTIALLSDTNPNPNLGDYTVTVNWGDGTSGPAFVTRQGGVLSVTGTHLYSVAGTENISVTVEKRDGQTQTVQSVVEVGAAPLVGAFGSELGRTMTTVLLPPDSNGTQVGFTLANGQGQAYRETNTGNYDLLLTGRNMSFTIRVVGGRHITLGSVIINGSVIKIVAPGANVGGTFYVNSSIGTATLGDVTGDVIAAGAINSLTVHSLRGGRVLSAVNLGADGALGGGGASSDSYSAGVIGALRVQTSISNAIVAAGASPGPDGFIGTADDTGLGGGIFSIIAGSIDSSSRFEANYFGKARLPGKVIPAADRHFIVLT